MSPSLHRALAAVGLATALGLAGCITPRVAIESHEKFDSTETHARSYAVLDAQACEAARRTLLSQGYVIGVANAETVRGKKSFQPGGELHVEVEFTVVCAKDGYAGRRAIAFVNAVQDSFVVKKGSTSASLGLPAFGAVSVPFIGSDEALVKVASATITSRDFYDRFFAILERYLEGDRGQLIPNTAAALDPAGVASAAAGAASAASAPPH